MLSDLGTANTSSVIDGHGCGCGGFGPGWCGSWYLFNKNINNIERKILDKVEENRNIFPKKFDKMFKWLNDRNVMTNYKDIDFLERAFQGLARNIRKGEILNQAITELKNNYELFEEKSIEEFFYVKKESIKEFSKK